MIVVSDTTPLRYLAVLGLLDLLPRPPKLHPSTSPPLPDRKKAVARVETPAKRE